ncbi:MAG TPA: TonB family protein [Povalibacter sp.]
MISQNQTRHLIAGGVILLAHAGAVFALLSLSIGPKDAILPDPVAVRFIAEVPARAQWQPPEVRAVAPDIVAPMPDVPLVESPVLPPSEHAITVPVQVPLVAQASSSDASAPRLISTVEYLRQPVPRYPPQSRKLREQGLVVLRVLIDERGAACSVEVETSSGHERLDHAAREAVSRAAFRPYVEDGLPRRAFVLIPIEFSLNHTAA